MTPSELEQTLTIIAAKAKDLRAAGVTGRLSIGDVHFDLDAADQAPVLATQPAEEADPLNDADTYGGELPKRRQPRSTEDEQE